MNIHSAAAQGNVARVNYWLQMGRPVDEKDEHGFTPLHWAARKGHQEVVTRLVQLRANANERNCASDTALHYAASEGHFLIARMLCESAGADVNAKNRHGNTPLHYACFWRHQQVAEYLVSRGAGPTILNMDAKSPLDLASPAMVGTLSSMGASAGTSATPSSVSPGMGSPAGMSGMGSPMGISPGTPVSPAPPPSDMGGGDADADAADAASAMLDDLLGDSNVDLSVLGLTSTTSSSSGAPAAPVKHDWEIEMADVEFGRFLGRGAFGEVWYGVWRGTEVAIKKLLEQKLSPQALEEFQGEVEIMSKLRHPNVTLFMGACLEASSMCLLTEYLDRGSLYSVLHDPSCDMDWALLVRMATDAAKGMAYLHGNKPPIIHRDLKSLNLLVDTNWTVKITDFGLTTAKEASGTMTQCGTPQWMAPEVLRNEPYDYKADIYSFAIVLWEMATRQIPYEGMNPMQVGMKVLLEGLRPVIPGYVPKPFETLIVACWDADPAARPDFKDILTNLRAIKV
ncbi:TKL/DRK protein kinase [Thecamonas trahens ATCC 50062]|uniref:non-specific serine/threonine protein kinase n=1 Tax=Thecamonas trahens ATCC 50062 TaxID=461836 RepID=A0A0L0DVA6_THETB|nr:TKL/DRK protein kinase [Thecamonas trahens ATCC 50062]KNC56031.1 TKL/DRK protein kinase [Thecamonas trahens ATCC 50062]|eukprot:XP_013761075.1 TKL/DRK protein kinase [Thecamonas trahens ATCC 50062]